VMRVVDLDYERIGGRAVYFTVLFYEPIHYAATRGLPTIDYGVEAFETKLLRGCRHRPLWSVLTRVPGGVLGREEARRWNARVYRRWQVRYGALTGELPEREWTVP
jgi:hypothetical protein